MALTRKLLKEMQLTDEQIEQIISAHTATTDALKAELDTASQENETLHAQLEEITQTQQSAAEVQAAFDDYRAQVENDQATRKATQLLRLSMIQAGCNDKVVDLLIQSIDPAALTLENGVLANQDALIAELRSKHAAFFSQPVRMPAPGIHPPVPTGGALTREDLSRMSADEINRNWNAVKGVLAKGAI